MLAGGRLVRRHHGRCESSPNRHTQPPSSTKFRGRKCPALALVQGKTLLRGSATNLHTNVLPLCEDRSCREISRAHPGRFAAPEEVGHSIPAHFRSGSNRPQFACPARECDKKAAAQRGCPRLESSHTHPRFAATTLRLWNHEVRTYISAGRRRLRSHATTCVPEGGRSSSRRLACLRLRSVSWRHARADLHSGQRQGYSPGGSSSQRRQDGPGKFRRCRAPASSIRRS